MMDTPTYLRKDTIKFTFSRKYVRPKPLEIKLWFEEKVKIRGDDIDGVHLSFVQNAVYLKFKDPAKCRAVIDACGGKIKFNHSDGNVSEVQVSQAGLGIRTVRVFELPFEIPAEEIDAAFQPYGTVISNEEEKWPEAHMWPVRNGVRQVKIELLRHLPSYMNICGYRALIMYDGQPRTCAICGSTAHERAKCNKPRVVQLPAAEVVSPGPVTTMKLTYTAAAVSPKQTERTLVDQGMSFVQQINTVNDPEVSQVAGGLQTNETLSTPTTGQNDNPSGHSAASLGDDLLQQNATGSEQHSTGMANLSHNAVHENDGGTLNTGGVDNSQNLDTEPPSSNASIPGEQTSPQEIRGSATPSIGESNDNLSMTLSQDSNQQVEENSLTKSPKQKTKGNKRRLAHEGAEALAPVIKEKLRNIKDGKKIQKTAVLDPAGDCRAGKGTQSSRECSSDESQMTLDSTNTQGEQQQQTGRCEWTDEIQEQEQAREGSGGMDFS